jgi:hypothetical protein
MEKTLFDFDEIISILKSKEGSQLIYEISNILKEKRKDLIEKCLRYLGKDNLIFFIEKTFNIMNSGGIEKKNHDNFVGENNFNLQENKKSLGGVFFYLIKKESELPKNEIKEIFSIDYKNRRDRKKMMKKIENMII